MIFNGEQTIYNIILQNRRAFGKPYVIQPNTTLNERFNVERNYDLYGVETYPDINLITIGVRDNPVNAGSTRLQLMSSAHSAIDASLFQPTPLYMRKLDEVADNPPSEKLRLKKEYTYNGEQYLVYYGYMVSDVIYKDDIITFKNIDTEYSNISKLDTNTADLLYPEPIGDLDITHSDHYYVGDFIKIYTFFTKEELLEIEHAMDVLYPGVTKKIAEVGVCTSYEVTLESDGRLENVGAQIAYFVDSSLDIATGIAEEKLDFFIEVGGMEIVNR